MTVKINLYPSHFPDYFQSFLVVMKVRWIIVILSHILSFYQLKVVSTVLPLLLSLFFTLVTTNMPVIYPSLLWHCAIKLLMFLIAIFAKYFGGNAESRNSEATLLWLSMSCSLVVQCSLSKTQTLILTSEHFLFRYTFGGRNDLMVSMWDS